MPFGTVASGNARYRSTSQSPTYTPHRLCEGDFAPESGANNPDTITLPRLPRRPAVQQLTENNERSIL